jgi:hypothetical protein
LPYANQGGGLNTDQDLALFGAGAYSAENLSGISRIGSNLLIYTATARGGVFFGNQVVKIFSVAGIGKLAGRAGAIVGTAVDTYGIYKGTTTVGTKIQEYNRHMDSHYNSGFYNG